MRQAITPHERLTATLRFLAAGRSYEDLKFSTVMSPQAREKIIPEICRAIYKVLKEYCKIRVHRLAVTPSLNFAYIFVRILVLSA
jgi:hypothetical protein